LLVIPSSNILVSGSSDKTAKLWDLSPLASSEGRQKPLHQLASLSGHRRPVDSLGVSEHAPDLLLTGDSMGVIKVWTLEDRYQSSSSNPPTVKATVKEELGGHRTGVNAFVKDPTYLWSASTDQTVTLRKHPSDPTSSPLHTFEHKEAVKCILVLTHTLSQPYLLTGSGDAIRLYDVSELVEEEAEASSKPFALKGKEHLITVVDAHSQNVTQLDLWLRKPDGEPWIVSSSLDGTLRRWKLSDLVEKKVKVPKVKQSITSKPQESVLTEEEEQELAELMGEE